MVGNKHKLLVEENTLTIYGIVAVCEVSPKQAQFKLDGCTLTVKGSDINMTKLDKAEGLAQCQTGQITSVTYHRAVSLKGLFG